MLSNCFGTLRLFLWFSFSLSSCVNPEIYLLNRARTSTHCQHLGRNKVPTHREVLTFHTDAHIQTSHHKSLYLSLSLYHVSYGVINASITHWAALDFRFDDVLFFKISFSCMTVLMYTLKARIFTANHIGRKCHCMRGQSWIWVSRLRWGFYVCVGWDLFRIGVTSFPLKTNTICMFGKRKLSELISVRGLLWASVRVAAYFEFLHFIIGYLPQNSPLQEITEQTVKSFHTRCSLA